MASPIDTSFATAVWQSLKKTLKAFACLINARTFATAFSGAYEFRKSGNAMVLIPPAVCFHQIAVFASRGVAGNQ